MRILARHTRKKIPNISNVNSRIPKIFEFVALGLDDCWGWWNYIGLEMMIGSLAEIFVVSGNLCDF